ncbi:hypothetical protein RHECNPAF_4300133 [Rhizobium etli CNPAF512]|nr:hypothetical protein RHECNPAF_4300133 [Rhizobium etli CNPAF512]
MALRARSRRSGRRRHLPCAPGASRSSNPRKPEKVKFRKI